ncbi:Mov34/MPN/PAD-1 family protein [Deinococcus marmoris]|uniref:Mov34/MPN/PAD-1 family protein n=1 Tax=Deinococcus marmoris TaxID=249408 RepID=UPI001B8066AF|nr:Mov34/MPN/PAD-1 family protein [Deinococcus marmoris]
MLPASLAQQLVTALRRAGSREIGGVLMGEHVGENLFRIVECTVQTQGGTASRFVRQAESHTVALDRFAEQHGHDPRRFNYLGEWHSHPCHPLVPSPTDIGTMEGIVNDLWIGANFAVLLLVRLGRAGALEAAARIYLPGAPAREATLILESRMEATDDH